MLLKESLLLENYFSQYNCWDVVDIFDILFYRVYTKCLSDTGLYLFYNNHQDDSFIEQYVNPSLCFLHRAGGSQFIIHNYEESDIIPIFVKRLKRL